MALRVQISNTDKRQKGRNPTDVRAHSFINANHIGILAQEPGQLRVSQLVALEKVIQKALKKIPGSHYDLRVYPHIPLTKKPNETGLGRGKGPIQDRVCRVAKNQIIVELKLDTEPTTWEKIAKEVNSKLSVKTKMVTMSI